MKFASFGLGDTSYPKYNWAHRKLYNRLVQLGAQPVCDRGESDEQQPEGYVRFVSLVMRDEFICHFCLS
jgi:sulfite reductase alpha subunit-like flavoprotein